MIHNPEKFDTMPVGVVMRRAPGVTRWAKWSWKAIGVLPGAAEADWALLRTEGDISDFHAATVSLELHGSDAEAYLHGLSARVPCLYVVLRPADQVDPPLEVTLVTASPYEAQDYADSGEELIEKVPMPEGIVAWVRDFAQLHYQEEQFKKRRRDKKDVDGREDGIGDARILQLVDVYRTPSSAKKERLQ